MIVSCFRVSLSKSNQKGNILPIIFDFRRALRARLLRDKLLSASQPLFVRLLTQYVHRPFTISYIFPLRNILTECTDTISESR